MLAYESATHWDIFMSTTTQQGSEVRLLVHVPKHQNKKTVDCSLRNTVSLFYLFIGRVSKICLVFVTIFQFMCQSKDMKMSIM